MSKEFDDLIASLKNLYSLSIGGPTVIKLLQNIDSRLSDIEHKTNNFCDDNNKQQKLIDLMFELVSDIYDDCKNYPDISKTITRQETDSWVKAVLQNKGFKLTNDYKLIE